VVPLRTKIPMSNHQLCTIPPNIRQRMEAHRTILFPHTNNHILCPLPPPISGPMLAPMMHPTSQPSSGTPSTSTYNLGTSESATPSYAPYGSLHKKICIFHFLVLHIPLLLHNDNHMLGITLFSPFPFKNFKILNN
jgi:hypothetical protein